LDLFADVIGANNRGMSDPSQVQSLDPVILRVATEDDFPKLLRLAALDSATPPPPPLLVAEVAGELLVAVSMADGRAIADPFTHTEALVALARLRAARG
jgi:hypothetical protein